MATTLNVSPGEIAPKKEDLEYRTSTCFGPEVDFKPNDFRTLKAILVDSKFCRIPDLKEMVPMSFLQRLLVKRFPKYGLVVSGEIEPPDRIEIRDGKKYLLAFRFIYMNQEDMDKVLFRFGAIEPKDLAGKKATVYYDLEWCGSENPPIYTMRGMKPYHQDFEKKIKV